MRDRIFYTICFGFLFGVLLRSFIGIDLYLTILFSVISLALILFFSLISKNEFGILASIFVLTFCFGIFRFHLADVGAPNVFESQVGQKNTFSGVIVDEPDVRPNDQLLTVETISGADKTKVLISSDLDQDFKYGDEINFTGKLTKPKNFLTDQGKTFDYINYLRKDGILYTMSYPVTDIVSRGNGNKIKAMLFFAKEKFLDKINFLLPSPESIFASGLMLGDRSDFDQTLKQNFVNTGMIHLVTLSGYKVTMVAGWFIQLFSFLPLGVAIGIGVLAVWCFVLMTGGIASAIRAGTMATLALIARATGRNYDVARALILTAVLMVLFNPFILFYDVSFQLSFLGTIAIIFFTPKIEKYFTWITRRFYLQEIITMTCAIYIFVFPYILYKMGDFSLVTLPANIFTMPLFPLTIMFGFLTGFVGLFSNILASPFAYMTYFSLHYQLFVINFFANLQFAAFNIPNFPLWLTLLIYACLTYILFCKNIKNFFTERF
ncbi:MAG: ComEC/Rec2 family competence protein [Candidatus Pacebacteria bacterium]|nr:ComEC/Rec2 family competence protein [Candidatus Paceibacterota bacterium]